MLWLVSVELLMVGRNTVFPWLYVEICASVGRTTLMLWREDHFSEKSSLEKVSWLSIRGVVLNPRFISVCGFPTASLGVVSETWNRSHWFQVWVAHVLTWSCKSGRNTCLAIGMSISDRGPLKIPELCLHICFAHGVLRLKRISQCLCRRSRLRGDGVKWRVKLMDLTI